MLHTHEVDGSSPPVSTTRKSLSCKDFRFFIFAVIQREKREKPDIRSGITVLCDN